jgi:hypothetical protein
MRVKKLSVTVTYKVGLGDVEMPKKVYDQIIKAAEKGDEIEGAGRKYQDASEWLSSNIKEMMCLSMTANVLQIGDGRVFQHKSLFGELKFRLPQNCQAETKPRLLPMCCYMPFFSSRCH